MRSVVTRMAGSVMVAAALWGTALAHVPMALANSGVGWSLSSVAEPTNFNAADTQNEVVELVVTATEGEYKLHPSLIAETTAAVHWNAPASNKEEEAEHKAHGPSLERVLENLPEIGEGNVAVTGGPGGTLPYMVTWTGILSGRGVGFLGSEESTLKDGAGPGAVSGHPVQNGEPRDRFAVVAVNVGSHASEGAVTIADALPQGVVPIELWVKEPVSGTRRFCPLAEPELICTWPASEPPLRPGRVLVMEVEVAVSSPSITGSLVNSATVTGGGGTTVSTSASNSVNDGPAKFGIAGFSSDAIGLDGLADSQAGDHPSRMTTVTDLNTVLTSNPIEKYHDAQEPKTVSVELPLGFAGDPLATARCPEIDLTDAELKDVATSYYHPDCPASSMVGQISFVWTGGLHSTVYPVYNVVPERGYPAELGFNAGIGQPIFLYANVIPSATGYRLRVDAPGVLRVTGLVPEQIEFTVFGDPGAVSGTGSHAAFVTNPTRCSAEPTDERVEVTSWEGGADSAEAIAYPELTGCELLQGAAAFDPSIAVEPETTQADTPSGYVVDLKIPQAPSMFGALATPDLKSATITLPKGVSISSSAANGVNALVGCTAPQIDLMGTEVGEGHPGGNGSSYDDGMTHAALGHCPENSNVGEVEVKTPDLAEPLHGQMYLAEPRCGGSGQPACTEAAAEEGEVFGVYLEVSGSGVIVKEAGVVEVGGYGAHSRESGLVPGQVRVRFDEIAQFPFEEVKVMTPGGQRTAFANPQTCGPATTMSELEPWSALGSGAANATPSSSFIVEGCSGPTPFQPGFAAGTVTPIAGGYSPLVLQLSRHDGEQDLSGLETTLPEGLLAKLAGVPECGDAEAVKGSCSSASQIGTVTATLGSGSEPLTQTGRVYLTGPYEGGPFGEVTVVPAVAGPFNLGNVVVRGAIQIDPNTAQASIVSDPFPTLVDGVPVRLKTLDVEVNRPEFTFNPTDCDAKAVTGTLTAVQGAKDRVSSPFAVTGCANMPFKPAFTTSTQAKTSRVNGASLVVKVAQKPGEANIHEVHLQFPKALPARLATLRKACTETQFAANPAGCPEGSVIGTGTAVTPVLDVPLSGPAYLVSHGGAAYPDVVFVLQGDNVKIDLTGHTDIKKSVTYSTFETLPDAPVTSFEAVLPEGPHAIFGANLPAKAKGSFCGHAPMIDITSQGQNGAASTHDAKAKVTGCRAHKRRKSSGKRRAAKRRKKRK